MDDRENSFLLLDSTTSKNTTISTKTSVSASSNHTEEKSSIESNEGKKAYAFVEFDCDLAILKLDKLYATTEEKPTFQYTHQLKNIAKTAVVELNMLNTNSDIAADMVEQKEDSQEVPESFFMNIRGDSLYINRKKILEKENLIIDDNKTTENIKFAPLSDKREKIHQVVIQRCDDETLLSVINKTIGENQLFYNFALSFLTDIIPAGTNYQYLLPGSSISSIIKITHARQERKIYIESISHIELLKVSSEIKQIDKQRKKGTTYTRLCISYGKNRHPIIEPDLSVIKITGGEITKKLWELRDADPPENHYFSFLSFNLMMTYSAVSILLYGITTVSTIQRRLVEYPLIKSLLSAHNPALYKYTITKGLLALNNVIFSLSSFHYLLMLTVTSASLYYLFNQNKYRTHAWLFRFILSCLAIFCLFLFSVNTLYLAENSSKNASNLYNKEKIVVSVISLTLALGLIIAWIHYSKRQDLNLGVHLAFSLIIAGTLLNQKFIDFGTLNIASISLGLAAITGILLYKKTVYLTTTKKILSGLEMVGLVTLACITGYITFQPSYQDVVMQGINALINQASFFYAALAFGISLYHVYRLSNSGVRFYINEEKRFSKYYRWNVVNSSINVLMDLLFLYFCIYPMLSISIINLSMPKLNDAEVLKHTDTLKVGFNNIGKLLSEQTQICIVVFTVLLFARFLCSASIAWFAKKNEANPSSFFYQWGTVLKAKHSHETLWSSIWTGIFMGIIGIIAGGCLWTFNTKGLSSLVVLFSGIGLFLLFASIGLVKKYCCHNNIVFTELDSQENTEIVHLAKIKRNDDHDNTTAFISQHSPYTHIAYPSVNIQNNTLGGSINSIDNDDAREHSAGFNEESESQRAIYYR